MDSNLSDFIKEAYKRGKVKDLEEAFKDYPAENEWHKGNAELFLNKGKKD